MYVGVILIVHRLNFVGVCIPHVCGGDPPGRAPLKNICRIPHVCGGDPCI